MSYWTYIHGTIKVSVIGGLSQPHVDYIIKEVIEHLPKVTGTEHDMHVYINKCKEYSTYSSYDRFQNYSNLYNNNIWNIFEFQKYYMITIDASLRDRMFNQTLREFNNWLNRLSKRLYVEDITIKIEDKFYKELLITNAKTYSNMYEFEHNWIERL